MRNRLLLTISVTALLLACNDYDDPFKDDPYPQEPKASRTVLVYVAAENNLDSFIDMDLEEMKTGSNQLADDQNLLVYVNRATSASPYLARVYRGELVDTVLMPSLVAGSPAVAADPSVLSLALSKTRELYPAKSYGLVMWGHCKGWLITDKTWGTKAYGGSTGDNTSMGMGRYWMNFPDMSRAIANGMSGEKLSFIFGDCCSFVSIETAYELRNVADYIIGSPAEIPDRGAPYDICVQDFFLDDDLYRQLIDHYYDYWLDVYKMSDMANRYFNLDVGDLAGYSVPLVAVKSSELENLATATSNLLSAISDKISSPGNLDLDSTVYYGFSDYRYLYDMNHVIKKNAAAQDYSAWKSAFDKAVPYALHSSKWLCMNITLCRDVDCFDKIPAADCGTVSMFFPATLYDTTRPNWNKAIQQLQWNNVIHWEQYGW